MRVQEDRLKRFVTSILTKVGLAEDKARNAADVLVFADTRGIESQGIAQLPIYIKRIEAGEINPAADPKIISLSENICTIDSEKAMGPVAACFGAETAHQCALEKGIGIAAVENSSHFGNSSFYAMQGLDRGIIGFAMCGASRAMDPWKEDRAIPGTGSFSIAIPDGKGQALEIDMPGSLISQGNFLLGPSKSKGFSPPETANDDFQGTGAPGIFLQGLLGCTAPLKGSGMSTLIDMVYGTLSSSKWLMEAGQPEKNPGTFRKIRCIFGGINIEAFMDITEFYSIMDDCRHSMQDCFRTAGFSWTDMAGETEYRKYCKAPDDGIELSEAAQKALETSAAELGLSVSAYA